jgi:hypothetical protein
MSSSAHVQSVAALQHLHGAFADLRVAGQEALAAATLQLQRAMEGLRDQLAYWRRQVDRCQEDVNRARADLAYSRSLREGVATTGCVEQEIALRKAQQRLRHAEEKVKLTRRWLLQLPEEMDDFEGLARRLAGMLDTDLRQFLARLQGKIDALEDYAAGRPAPLPTPSVSREQT